VFLILHVSGDFSFFFNFRLKNACHEVLSVWRTIFCFWDN